MPPSPWVILSATQPERDYLVLLSYLPLRSFWKLPAFVRHAQAIRRQLEDARGAIGYSMLAQLFRLQFWTLSVWQDRAALDSFVRADPHLKIMSALQGHMGETQFIEWQAAGSTLPPKWTDAMGRFRRENGA